MYAVVDHLYVAVILCTDLITHLFPFSLLDIIDLIMTLNTTQRQRKIKKLYLAVTTEPVPLGMHVHWMWASLNARGQQGGTPCQFVSHTPPESRKKAKVSVSKILCF